MLLLLCGADHRGRAAASFPRPWLDGPARRAACRRTCCAWSAPAPSSSARWGGSRRRTELAACAGVSLEEVLEAREAARARGGTSLDAPVGDEEGATIGDLVGDADEGFEQIDAALLADSLIATLAERDQTIVRLRFEQELTQQEIGRYIGCSQMQVSRLLRAALARLRAEASAAGLRPPG